MPVGQSRIESRCRQQRGHHSCIIVCIQPGDPENQNEVQIIGVPNESNKNARGYRQICGSQQKIEEHQCRCPPRRRSIHNSSKQTIWRPKDNPTRGLESTEPRVGGPGSTKGPSSLNPKSSMSSQVLDVASMRWWGYLFSACRTQRFPGDTQPLPFWKWKTFSVKKMRSSKTQLASSKGYCIDSSQDSGQAPK